MGKTNISKMGFFEFYKKKSVENRAAAFCARVLASTELAFALLSSASVGLLVLVIAGLRILPVNTQNLMVYSAICMTGSFLTRVANWQVNLWIKGESRVLRGFETALFFADIVIKNITILSLGMVLAHDIAPHMTPYVIALVEKSDNNLITFSGNILMMLLERASNLW